VELDPGARMRCIRFLSKTRCDSGRGKPATLVLGVVGISDVGALDAYQGLPALGDTLRSRGRPGNLIDCSMVTACCGCGKTTMLVLVVVGILGMETRLMLGSTRSYCR
jgi:hypothetical protein